VNKTTKRVLISLTAGMLAIGAVTTGGCASDAEIAKGKDDQLADGGKTGTQLWSDNCARCHNLRGPETFSSTQWELITHHMRLRANLTGSETRKITAFLKSAS
jgi:mono/diheme cytochrome c family protein